MFEVLAGRGLVLAGCSRIEKNKFAGISARGANCSRVQGSWKVAAVLMGQGE
jgi:hypothetical protein